MSDRDNMNRDIHAARLANLEPPELGESLAEYVGRMVREHGSTYQDAAAERHRGHALREARAVKDAARELRRFMLPKRARGRK